MPRHTDYDPEYHDKLAYKLAILGLIDKEIAAVFEITPQTLYNWKKQESTFFEAIKKGKEIANANVAEALYKRAIGYSHIETKLFQHTDKDGKHHVIEHDVIKHYPPDATAAIIFLKNRQPDKWKDRKEHEISGSIDTTLSDISIEELKKRLQELETNE